MDFNSVLSNIGDKLPRDGLAAITLKEKFERLSEERKKDVLNQLPMLKLKSPALVFWVGTFLFGSFGVGRFYDRGFGFRICTFINCCCSTNFCFWLFC